MIRSPSARLEDRLGPLEPSYRSRGEAQVGRMLDRYGIPFVHEQPTSIHDRGRRRSWHPDFTLPAYNGLILEYAGMMDVPDYAAGIGHKRRAYARNGLRVLFIYPRDLRGPSWPERLAERIRRAGMSTYDDRPTYGFRRSIGRPGYAIRGYRRSPRYRAMVRRPYGRAR
ncbi:MAG TPA: hypothetical protein PKK06_05640 [Phycisphaerae bacterium]|nr:hypothetical protein [Phycisphaerae bacterium]HNU44759.1 hypothetical protein [Phycisphaerae bacterium]